MTGPDKSWPIAWWATRFILFLAGARACHLTPKNCLTSLFFDGVVIGGGDDIDPIHYGEKGDAGSLYDAARDQLEMNVLKAAMKTNVPIFGICRGMQLINIYHGGTLYTDIRSLRRITPNINTAFPIKWATIFTTSKLYKIMSKKELKINSLHNQAIREVGEGLVSTAIDRDNFIQGIESKNSKQFLLGVQWHPEYMPYKKSQRSLFKSLVEKAKVTDAQLSLSDFQVKPLQESKKT